MRKVIEDNGYDETPVRTLVRALGAGTAGTGSSPSCAGRCAICWWGRVRPAGAGKAVPAPGARCAGGRAQASYRQVLRRLR